MLFINSNEVDSEIFFILVVNGLEVSTIPLGKV